MEHRPTTEIASVKSDVGALTADMDSVKSDGFSLRSELVSMDVRLSTALDHVQEVLAQATKQGFDDTAHELRGMHAMLGRPKQWMRMCPVGRTQAVKPTSSTATAKAWMASHAE